MKCVNEDCKARVERAEAIRDEWIKRLWNMTKRAYKAELDLKRVQRQCAALREALRRSNDLLRDIRLCDDDEGKVAAQISDNNDVLASDAGHDLFTREQVMPLVKALHWMELTDAAHSAAARADCKFCMALAHAKSIGLIP